jgi:hypothetical protein
VTSNTLIAIIAVVAALALVGLAVVGFVLWQRSMKQELQRLLGRREAIHSALRTVERVVSSLAEASDGDLVTFALDGDAEDRRALGEVAMQMRIQRDELEAQALPKALHESADALGAAAGALAEQTERTETVEGVEVLDALAAIEFSSVRTQLLRADVAVRELAERYGVDEAAFYGGGMYI